jgi:hypothetical protein
MDQIQLFVEHTTNPITEKSIELFDGADGLIVDPALVSVNEVSDFSTSSMIILRAEDPDIYEAWQELDKVVWTTECGLTESARLCDEYSDLTWVPRLNIEKSAKRYQFSNVSHGEGFKVYVPDTSTIRGYRVSDGDSDSSLEKALAQASRLGFKRLWLHALDAESAGSGFDLDMLDRARGWFSGDIWLSGGATAVKHLENLATEGGVEAAIVTEDLVQEHECATLTTALKRQVAEIPIQFMA